MNHTTAINTKTQLNSLKLCGLITKKHIMISRKIMLS